MAMCGEPRVAAECTCTEREVGRCSCPTVRPGRNVNDERDHGAGSDIRPRGRRTSGSLTETRVRDWQYWPERFDGSADRTMNPCALDGTGQRAWQRLVAHRSHDPDVAWRVNGLAVQSEIEPSVREKPPARRPRGVLSTLTRVSRGLGVSLSALFAGIVAPRARRKRSPSVATGVRSSHRARR